MLFHRGCPPGSFSLAVFFPGIRVAVWVLFTAGRLHLHMKRASLIVGISFFQLQVMKPCLKLVQKKSNGFADFSN